MRLLPICIALFAACSTGGQYQTGTRQSGGLDRGETNGRQFDFISNMPDGDDWQIRVRDSSLWAAYGEGEEVKELGTANMSNKDTSKLWELVDAIEIPDRKKGYADEDEGWVQLRLREPGDEEHDLFETKVSRADAEDDEEVLALAAQLQKLVQKYFKKKPEF